MLFMIIERFHNHDPLPVYTRFQNHGRLAPAGLTYISSWVSQDLSQCYQVMEAEKRELVDQWIKEWEDLVDFEVVEVMGSEEAKTRVLGQKEKKEKETSRGSTGEARSTANMQ